MSADIDDIRDEVLVAGKQYDPVRVDLPRVDLVASERMVGNLQPAALLTGLEETIELLYAFAKRISILPLGDDDL